MIELEVCKRTDMRYQAIRNRHYLPNKGTHGQQIHFIIWYKGDIVGIISGASSVYGVKARDEFFGIPPDRDKKQKLYLPAIINNTVFRLEYHEHNLATRVLSRWRKVTAQLWEMIYGIQPIGFETFVMEEDWRKGSLYKADNWTLLGTTAGSTKVHSKGMNRPSEREVTTPKLIYARWCKKPVIPNVEYSPSWRQSDPDEKERARRIQTVRNGLYGVRY